jgi:hypothetical protein
MPRGLCENCGRHDVFVYPVPLAFGRTVFVCARCLKLPQAVIEDDEDEDDEWDLREHQHDADDVGKNTRAGVQPALDETPRNEKLTA